MSILLGPRTTDKGIDRLHDDLTKIVVLTVCVSAALRWTVNPSAPPFEKGRSGTLTCVQFDREIKIPSGGILETIAANKRPDRLGIFIQAADPVGLTGRDIHMPDIITLLVAPVFVGFVESHLPWLRANIGADLEKWPGCLQFGRVVRNAIAHRGEVCFNAPNSPNAVWHHMTYSYADNGRVIIGTDLALGDLIILLFEMSDELDRLGCPLLPP